MISTDGDKEQNTNTLEGTRRMHREVSTVGAIAITPITALNDAFRRSFIGGDVVENDRSGPYAEAART